MPRYTTHSPAVQQRLAEHKGFKTGGSFWATIDRTEVYNGRMPDSVASEFEAHHREGLIDYYVLSFGTPIAWVRWDGVRVIPDIKYSVTTTRHQNIVREAWGLCEL